MESEGRTSSIDECSQKLLKKEDSRSQTQHLNNLDRVNHHNNEFTNATKIFVGGLPADLTKDEFKAYFEKFGSIEDVVVMSDKETNKPRRFGFVTFDSPDTANSVLKNRFYELKNKRVEVKKALSKERMTRKFGSYYDTYNNAMYNGTTFPYATTTSYGVYYYGMNSYGYGAYSGIGCEVLPYFYYPYPNPSYYDTTCSYQNPYYYADTYSYMSPYSYHGNNPKHSYKYRNRSTTTPVVIKKKSHVKNGDGDHDVRKNTKVSSEVNDEESSVTRDALENGDDGDHAETSDSLSVCCNGEGDGGCAEGIQALSLYSDGLGEQMGADGESSSCTFNS
ncbi:unnamed protein product [Lactuca saligna]|uniref:RRM domain-containing protein n=1 Tax=Lactuca saligna TaxID=75948 RepID=A0AA35YMQ4_LACSI|nr:unnamed protein product [Lactuca saligna]